MEYMERIRRMERMEGMERIARMVSGGLERMERMERMVQTKCACRRYERTRPCAVEYLNLKAVRLTYDEKPYISSKAVRIRHKRRQSKRVS